MKSHSTISSTETDDFEIGVGVDVRPFVFVRQNGDGNGERWTLRSRFTFTKQNRFNFVCALVNDVNCGTETKCFKSNRTKRMPCAFRETKTFFFVAFHNLIQLSGGHRPIYTHSNDPVTYIDVSAARQTNGRIYWDEYSTPWSDAPETETIVTLDDFDVQLTLSVRLQDPHFQPNKFQIISSEHVPSMSYKCNVHPIQKWKWLISPHTTSLLVDSTTNHVSIGSSKWFSLSPS